MHVLAGLLDLLLGILLVRVALLGQARRRPLCAPVCDVAVAAAGSCRAAASGSSCSRHQQLRQCAACQRRKQRVSRAPRRAVAAAYSAAACLAYRIRSCAAAELRDSIARGDASVPARACPHVASDTSSANVAKPWHRIAKGHARAENRSERCKSTHVEPEDEAPPYQIGKPEEFAPQPAAAVRAGRPRADRVHRARRRQDRAPIRPPAEISEATKTLSDLARIWMADPTTLRRGAGHARALLRRPVEQHRAPHARAGGDAGRRARARRQPLQGSGVVVEPLLRFLEAGLSGHLAVGRGPARSNTDGLDERTRQKAEFYLRQVSSALSPSNFPMTNPEVLRETLATNAENLVQGMTLARRGHEPVRRSAEDQPDRRQRLRGRPQPRDHARQGRLPERPPAAHPVRADDRQGARACRCSIVPPWINKYYILDLTPAKSFIKFARRPGLHGVRRSPGSTRTSTSRTRPSRTTCRRASSTAADAVQARDRASRRSTSLGYCVGGTLLGDDARLSRRARRGAVHARRRFLDDAGRLLARPAICCCSPTTTQLEALERADGRARLPRRLAHGQRVQHDAAARPDLALHRQQLPARQEAVPVRPALLEPGFDAHGGGQPQLLSARVLQREPPRQGRDDDRRHAARPRSKVKLPDLRARDERGPHRAGDVGVHAARRCSAARSSSCWRAPATSPASSTRPTRSSTSTGPTPKPRPNRSSSGWRPAKEHPGSWWPHWAEWLAKHSGDWIDAARAGRDARRRSRTRRAPTSRRSLEWFSVPAFNSQDPRR